MVGAAEQKAVLPPINLMKPTHQFPIQTFFLNYARLKPHGVKPQEPDVKNSMLSACHGEKLPCTYQSTGRTLVQTKTFFLTNVTVKSNRWFFWSPCLQGDEHLLSHIALHILAWLVQQDGYCSLGKQNCFQGKSYTGVLGDSLCTTPSPGARPCHLTWRFTAWLVQPSAWTDTLSSRGLIPPESSPDLCLSLMGFPPLQGWVHTYHTNMLLQGTLTHLKFNATQTDYCDNYLCTVEFTDVNVNINHMF